jgi:hypothetical protein
VWNDFSSCVDLAAVLSEVYGKSGYGSRDILAVEYDSAPAHKYSTVSRRCGVHVFNSAGVCLDGRSQYPYQGRMLPWIQTGNFHQRVRMLSSGKVESMLLNHNVRASLECLS